MQTSIDSTCPLDGGQINADISLMVRGEGEKRRVVIHGESGSKVISLSTGLITRVDKSSATITVKNQDTLYSYSGLTIDFEKGEKVLKGAVLGKLKDDLLFFSVKKDGKFENPIKYIDCLEND